MTVKSTPCKKDQAVHFVKCKCGAFEAKVCGESFQAVTCHCHGCVSSKRYMTNKPNELEGVPLSLYTAKQVTFLKPDMKNPDNAAKFGFVKVGPKGKLPRAYCKTCKQHIFNRPDKAMIAFNREAMYEEDGVTKHTIHWSLNINANNSFDPSKVPSPKHDGFGPKSDVIFKIAPKVVGTKLPGGKDLTKNQALFPDPSTMEVVPITW